MKVSASESGGEGSVAVMGGGLRAKTGAYTWRMAGLARGAVSGQRWLATFPLAGAFPLLLGLLGVGSLQQVLSAVAVFLLLLSAVRAERAVVGIVGTGLAFLSHNALAIGIAVQWPEAAAAMMPDGVAYWEAQKAWIISGTDPEYEVVNWLPHHAQLLVGAMVLGILTFGLLPLVQGFYEVDLMNYYVGNLLAASEDGWTALLLGWHPWSLCRGVCFAILNYELASWTLQWLTGRLTSPSRGRRARLFLVLAWFLADVVLKYGMLDVVRDGLKSSLAG